MVQKKKFARSKHWFDLDIEWVEEIPLQDNLSLTRNCFKAILKVNMGKSIPKLRLLLEMQNKQAKLNTILSLHSWIITRMLQICFASVV